MGVHDCAQADHAPLCWDCYHRRRCFYKGSAMPMSSCLLPLQCLKAPTLHLFFSFELLISSQKLISIDLLNQASFSSLKLLPFDNILIVTKESMQKIRNALPAHLLSSPPSLWVGMVGWSPGLWDWHRDAFEKEATLVQLLHQSWDLFLLPPSRSSLLLSLLLLFLLHKCLLRSY